MPKRARSRSVSPSPSTRKHARTRVVPLTDQHPVLGSIDGLIARRSKCNELLKQIVTGLAMKKPARKAICRHAVHSLTGPMLGYGLKDVEATGRWRILVSHSLE